MSRIFLIVIVLMAVSLYSVGLIEESVIAPAKETKETAKPDPKKPVYPPPPARNVVIRAERGHFAADARVDGRPIAFVVDTGASYITIRESEATRLGYYPRAQDFVVRIQTANGEGRAARIELRTVELGDITVRDVSALVVPDSALKVNLLGMSFLSRVSWTHERGELVLEQ